MKYLIIIIVIIVCIYIYYTTIKSNFKCYPKQTAASAISESIVKSNEKEKKSKEKKSKEKKSNSNSNSDTKNQVNKQQKQAPSKQSQDRLINISNCEKDNQVDKRSELTGLFNEKSKLWIDQERKAKEDDDDAEIPPWDGMSYLLLGFNNEQQMNNLMTDIKCSNAYGIVNTASAYGVNGCAGLDNICPTLEKTLCNNTANYIKQNKKIPGDNETYYLTDIGIGRVLEYCPKSCQNLCKTYNEFKSNEFRNQLDVDIKKIKTKTLSTKAPLVITTTPRPCSDIVDKDKCQSSCCCYWEN